MLHCALSLPLKPLVKKFILVTKCVKRKGKSSFENGNIKILSEAFSQEAG
jgi:hypothetical protein